ncbi:sensor histidine kinase [Pseudoxanthomonas indica]|nr:histidine kinase [Pseudoxanthomonas indica]
MASGSAAPPVDHAVLRALFAQQEALRQQVARALHNEIGQAVSAIKMSAHLAGDEDDAAQRREDLAEIVRIADDTVARLRELYSVLRPPQLEALGLQASLRGEAEAWQARWGVPAHIEVALADEDRAAAAIELTAFRSVQDVLLAPTALSRLAITAARIDDCLALRIEHDGEAPDAGLLAQLHARANAYGGELALTRSTAGHVQVDLRLPWRGVPT